LNLSFRPYDEICQGNSLTSVLTRLSDPPFDRCARKAVHCKAPNMPPTSVDACCTVYRSMRCMVATLSQPECNDPTGVMYLNAWLNSYRVEYAQGVCQPDLHVTDDMCPDLPV